MEIRGVKYLLFGLLVFLTINLTNSLNLIAGHGIIQSVNAQRPSLAEELGRPLTTSQVLPNTQRSVVLAQGLTSSITSIGCTSPSSPHGFLTINKAFSSTNVDQAQLNTLQFTLNVIGLTQVTNTLTLTQLNPITICVNTGQHFVISENTPSQSGFQFGSVVYDLVGATNVNNNFGCAGNIIAGQNATCTITNNVLSGSASGTTTNNGLILPSGSPTSQTGTQVRRIIEGQGLPGPTTTEAGTNTAKGKLTNPPFQICVANTVNETNQLNPTRIANQNIDLTSTKEQDLNTRLPSSGTYVLRGTIPLDSVRNALQKLDTRTFTIVLKSDLNPDDKLITALAAPQYEGEVIVQSSDGAKQKNISFKLDTVRTECKYITLAQAVGPSPNANVAPLGLMGNTQGSSVRAPDINKELIGGLTVGTSPAGRVPTILNPPFATCQTTPTGSIQPDQLALYTIKGDTSSGLTGVHGNTLTVELTADLVQSDVDLAKIVKTDNNRANNPFLIANLIADENTDKAHKIDFTLHDVNTDCKQVSLETTPTFRPFANELNN